MLYRARTTIYWSWDSWPCPLVNTLSGKLALSCQGRIFRKDGSRPHHRSIPHLASTSELSLSAWEPCPPLSAIPYSITEMRERCLSPLLPIVSERVGPWVTRVRELALPLISCSTQESRPCIPPGQYTRSDPLVCRSDIDWGHRWAISERLRAGELTPPYMSPTAIRRERALTLAKQYIYLTLVMWTWVIQIEGPETRRTDSSLGKKPRECWRVRLDSYHEGSWKGRGVESSYHPDPEPGLRVDPLLYLPHLWTVGVRKGDESTDPKQEDLYINRISKNYARESLSLLV